MKIVFQVDTPYELEDHELVHISNDITNLINFILGNKIVRWLWGVI